MKIGWLSDIHLNFVNQLKLDSIIGEFARNEFDAWIISGDIGEALTVRNYLNILSKKIKRPIYFVLGNHDFYGSSIEKVMAEVRQSVSSSEEIIWLTESDVCFLNEAVALIGDDGWGDGRIGEPLTSDVKLEDFFSIQELIGLDQYELVKELNILGEQSAARLAPKLEIASEKSKNVCVVTHVPTFKEATWHEGKISGPDWLPWFSCAAVGETIIKCAKQHPKVQFMVLCGHTHSSGYYKAAKNVSVYTAGAEYGRPELQGIVCYDGGQLFLDYDSYDHK